ncbi:T-cell surface glycoprotein CD3 epsilon chain-like [Acanthochromis polyacanthus]|uniref:T-cell surface glycoprotein CD3 epsilon chain-like n=1 Tax=Acanthochromis polyacanthus TaxID=80966 RepID=UPI0022341E69|nr:T-cell surface glycoprotein CD3 epsilon chain-like [Acanthochromis polyacanthus]
MHGMGVQAVLTVVLILFTATVKTHDGEISVWKTKVTLTCPEIGKWYKDDTVITEKTDDADLEIEEKSHTFTYEGKTTFHCEYTSQAETIKYYFRFEGKVCEDCYEVDARLIGLVIIVDIVGTALLMILICSCTKNKSSAGPAHSSKAPARSGGRPTPASSSEYEQLNRQTRSQDTYSVVNRTG